MTITVAYNFPSSQIAVGYFLGSPPAVPTISATPTVQDNAAITINGANFSASGNRVFLGDTELTVDTEGTTQIVTEAQVFTREFMLQPVELYVVNASDVESNRVSLLIQPATGQRVFAVTQAFLGDPSTRLESTPDLTPGDEIIIRNVQGTNVTTANVNVEGNGAADVAADTDNDPQVSSFEYAVFDGDQRSSTWAPVTWDIQITQTTTPAVAGLSETAASLAAIAANMTLSVVSSVYSSTIASGLVITQFPAAGASVNIGSVLEVTLSLGVAPTLVPDVGGLDVIAGAAALVNAGVTLGSIKPYVDGNNSGLIVNQSIAPGTAVTPGTVVDIAISTNRMPNVRNVDYVSARAILQAANLNVDDTATDFEFNASVANGLVYGQTPAADSIVSPLANVVLQVSLGAEIILVTVRATESGYFGGLPREPGDLFDITDPLQFSPYWMSFVDTPPDDWTPLLETLDPEVQRRIIRPVPELPQIPEPFRSLLQ